METDRVLSAEELDALLGRPDDNAAATSANGRRYDFSRPDAAAQVVLPLADMIFDTFATSLRTALLESLRLELQLEREGAKTVAADELLASLSDPCVVSLFEVPPLPGTALLALDGALIHSLVDGYFGGNGRGSAVRTRDTLSDIECRMGRRIRDAVFSALSDALVDFNKVACRMVREEQNPLLVGARHFRGPLVVLEISIALGERAGVVKLAIPQVMLEPLRASAAASLRAPEHAANADEDRWRSAIEDADIDLRCEMTRVGLSIRDLVELRRGDVIPVDIPERVSLDVAGIPILEGRFGIRKGRRALRVDRVLNLGKDRASPTQLHIEEDSDERVGIG